MPARTGTQAVIPMQGPQRFLASAWPFHLLLLVELAQAFGTRSLPSVDGPAHVYNATLLKALWTGDPIISAHFEIHPRPIPNWLDHAILAPLLFIMPGWYALKVLSMIHIAGTALAFRAVLRHRAPRHLAMAPLVIPLIHTFLFHQGFYNFCLGLMLFLLALAHWTHPRSRWRAGDTIMLTLIALLLYFSNVLALAMTIVVIATIILQRAVVVHHAGHSVPATIRQLAPIAIGTFVAFLPAVLLFLSFISHQPFQPHDPPRPLGELLRWLVDGHPLVIFPGHTQEEWITWSYPAGLLLLLGSRWFLPTERRWRQGDVLLIPIACFLALYLITPDSAHAGMMSDRYSLMLYLLVALWVACTVAPRALTLLVVVLAGCTHLFLLPIQRPHSQALDRIALDMRDAAQLIPEGAIVYPVSFSTDWRHGHVTNHVGADKPMVILENYEARLGWFPIRWLEDRPQQRCLGERVPYGVRCAAGPDAAGHPLPDHVLLFGPRTEMTPLEWPGLFEELDRSYRSVHRSTDGSVELYRLVDG